MVIKRRVSPLLAGTVIGASCLITASAPTDDPLTQQLQNQIHVLQKELQDLQQVSQAKTETNAAEQPALPGSAASRFTKGPPAWFSGVHISMVGNFLTMEGAWRQHSEALDRATDPPLGSSGIPLQSSVLWNENEFRAFRASAQQSRIAFKVTGDIDPAQHLKGYYEMDFFGATTDANNGKSLSLRMRF